MGAAILNKLTLCYRTDPKAEMMYQLEIWCTGKVNIDTQAYLVEISNLCLKFE